MGSRHSTAGAATVVMAAALALAGCSTGSKPPMPTSTVASGGPAASTTPAGSPSATSTAEATLTPAQATVLAAYNGYWRAKVAMLADPNANLDGSSPRWNELRQYATDTAVADVFATVHTFSTNGIIVVGSPVLDPKVSELTGDAASIVDCVDSTNWQPVYSASHKTAAAPGQSPRLITNSALIFYDNRWVVTRSAVDREKPC